MLYDGAPDEKHEETTATTRPIVMKGMPNRTSMSVMDFPTDIELIAVSSLEVELSVVSISKSKGFVRLVSFVGDLICL